MREPFVADFKEQVRAATDIVGLVAESRAVTPQRGGREYVALCPFHDDHNPSMRIYPERQTFRCWVCDTAGDCFSYLMKLEALPFPEALERLADRAGLQMPRQFGRGSKSNIDKTKLLEVLRWAQEQYHRYLLQSPEAQPARDYLLSRGFNEACWIEYQVGFSPRNRRWLVQQAGERFSLQQLELAKLARSWDGRGYSDFFSGRVMFPICNEQGHCVAFGGRVLPGTDTSNTGKYINSSDSVLFSKSRILYGLDHSKEAIRQAGLTVVVEGYTDCITAKNHGMAPVVGVLGTALTEAHVRLLKRFCQKVVLVFDGDDAGKNAANRALVKLLSQDVDLRMVTLPAGQDPADYLESRGLVAFQALIDQAEEAWAFKLSSLVNEHGIESIDGRQRVIDQMLELLAQAPALAGTTREDLVLNRLASRLQLPETRLRKQLIEKRQAPRINHSTNDSLHPINESSASSIEKELWKRLQQKTASSREQLEAELLQVLLTDSRWLPTVQTIVTSAQIQTAPLQTIFQFIERKTEQQNIGQPLEEDLFHFLLNQTEDLALIELITCLEQQAREMAFSEKLVMDSPTTESEPGLPRLLKMILDEFTWNQRQQTSQQLAHASAGALPAQPDALARLKMMTELQRDRITRQSPHS